MRYGVSEESKTSSLITSPRTMTTSTVIELFEIDGLKPETKLVVVNRWGNVVFETDDYQNDWNGKDLNGLPLLDGVYTYTLTTPDDNVKHGFIHLLR